MNTSGEPYIEYPELSRELRLGEKQVFDIRYSGSVKLEFMWWIKKGSKNWEIIRSWSPDIFEWQPEKAQCYAIQVDVRRQGEEEAFVKKWLGMVRVAGSVERYALPLGAKIGGLLGWFFSKCMSVAARFLGVITLKSGYDIFIADIACYYRPDVVHAHDLPVLPAGALCARKRGVPLIYDSHELYTEEELPAMDRALLKIKERFYIGKAEAVITVNPYIKKELEMRYSLQGVSVIENATNRHSGFDPTAKYDLFREEYLLPEESRLILYQGWFASHRNLATLVKGMPLLDNIYYLLLMGYGDYQQELIGLAKSLGVEKRVILVPAKTQDELLFYTASADVGVMPYLKSKNLNNLYSSPNKLYEFIASGLPVLANDLPYYRDINEKYHIGIVRDLESVETYVEAVREIFSMDLNQLKQNSLKAYEELNWDNEAVKLSNIYAVLEKGIF